MGLVNKKRETDPLKIFIYYPRYKIEQADNKLGFSRIRGNFMMS